MKKFAIIGTSLAALALAACSQSEDGKDGAANGSDGSDGKGATIYAISNKADGNTIVGYAEGEDGKFTQLGEFSTGGKGTGDLEVPDLKKDDTHPLANGDDPLISANALVANDAGTMAIAVNPGDSTVALMAIKEDGTMELVNTAASSDKFPLSVAINGDNVAVASMGEANDKGSIAAYKITDGKLAMVEGSRRDLQARPSTIAFSTDGEHVIVDELVSGKIKTFAVTEAGLSAEPTSMIDSPRAPETRFQAIPVGFDIRGDGGDETLIVSEARFLTPEFGLREGNGEVKQAPKYTWQTGSISSYNLTDDGKLSLVSGDVLTGTETEGGEIANCWVSLSSDGNVLFAANALSSSISTFNIAADGSATLRNQTAYKDAGEELFLSDMATSSDGEHLYQLVGNRGEILVMDIDSEFNLTVSQTLTGLPALGAYGMLVL